ncbi:hypothetical protein OSB04_008911 [Centaurea solstitialis]|uniref:Uncharacterized protein n=1 Tax=Centaurea solstitialis TaxID=347529 RepID=A0AA38WU48_9ASTR|nr:hypothetical protein OSB04_008911 [Centaurea solstitialis]
MEAKKHKWKLFKMEDVGMEWRQETYPSYVNIPDYIVSVDVAEFIAMEFKKHKWKLFKMEDVRIICNFMLDNFNMSNMNGRCENHL